MKLNRHQPTARLALRKQQGMTMLEVLIAVMILSVGLLGIAGLQTSNLRNSQSAHQRTMAVLLASSMAERIRANRALALSNGYSVVKTCPTTVLDPALITSASIAEHEKKHWLNEIARSIGVAAKPCGEVTFSGRTYTVTVYWDDSRALGGRADMAIRNMVSL